MCSRSMTEAASTAARINYIAYDDAYLPPKAVEHARKLVESDEVAFMFGQLGTPGLSATTKYYTNKGVPNLGIVSGAAKFTNVTDFREPRPVWSATTQKGKSTRSI